MNIDEKVSLAKKNIKTIKQIMSDYNLSSCNTIKKFSKDYLINLWVGNQKRLIVNGALSDEEVSVYREQNFDFGVKPLKWDEWFILIKEYCETQEVNEIPSHTISEKGYALDVWFNRQLRNRKKLSPEQLIKIESVRVSERKAYVIKLNGTVFRSAREFSSFTNIPYNIARNCAHIGMSGEEIISFCKTILLGEEIIYRGSKFRNLRDFADYYNIPINSWITDLQKVEIVENAAVHGSQKLIARGGQPKRRIYYNGREFNSTREFAEAYSIPYHFARECLQEGMTGEEILKQYWSKEFEKAFKQYFKPGRKIQYEGHLFVNTRVFADYYGISVNSASIYFRLGYTPQEVVEKCKLGRNREHIEGTHVVYGGKEYISIRKFADDNNLDYAYSQLLLREGYTPEEVVKIQYGESLVVKGKENKCSQFEGTHIVYGGKEYISIRQFVNENDLDYAHTQTLRKEGYTPEEIVKIHRGELAIGKEKEYKFYYRGEGYSSYSKFAEMYSIPYGRLRSLLKEGFNLDQILEINERGFRRGLKKDSVIDYDGHIYFDVYDFSSHYGLDYFYVVTRLRSGWSCDELINPDQHKIDEKTAKKNEDAISAKNIRKWGMSNCIDDKVLLAYAYYNGRVVQKDYKRAIGILEKLSSYAPAKLLLARCYLQQNDRRNKNARKAIQLIYEYNDETLENSIHGQGTNGLIDSVIPDLADAFSKVLKYEKEDLFVLESVKYFAEAIGSVTAICCLFEYYSDVSNFYYDIEEAKRYETLIDDTELINSIRKGNPYCIQTSIYKNGGESYIRLLLLHVYPYIMGNHSVNNWKRLKSRAAKEFDIIEEDWKFTDIAPETYIEEHFSREVSDILIYDY